MKTYYQTDLNKTYFIIEEEGEQKEDYQMRVLHENYISGIVAVEVRYIDNVRQYYYDVTGKTSLANLFTREKPGFEEIKQLMEGLLCVMKTLKKYMIGSEGLMFQPEMVFEEKGKYYFCFCMEKQQEEMAVRFHELTEFLVRVVDYKDEKGVHLAYVMHKATMEDNYSLEQIMRDFQNEFIQEQVQEQEIVTYHSTVVPTEENLVAEKIDWWEPVKRLLEKTRMRL